MKNIKRTVGMLLVLVMLLGMMPAMTIHVGAANAYIHRTPTEVTNMIQQYWNTVTDNGSNYRYWNNKLGRSFANNESYATLKARVINGGTSDYLNWTTSSPCSGSRSAHNSLTGANANICTSNWLEGTQCAGFAKYIQLVLFHTVYDESPEYFNKIPGSDISGINNHTFQPGDLIRLTDEYHSVVVSKVTNNQLYFIECNANYGLFSDAQKANCVIRYNRSMYISTMKQNLVNDPDSYIISPNSTLRSDSSATVTLPATPTNFAAAWQDGWKALVTWSPVSDATSYEVQYRREGKDWADDTDYSSGTYYTSTSLGAYEWYEYQVRAVNSNGASAWSAPLRINKTIVLNLNANGGTVSPTTHTVKYNNTAGTTNYEGSTGSIGTYGGVQNLPTPVRVGYNFDGWYLEPNFYTKVTDTSLRTRPYTNETLYAKWVEHAHSYSSAVTAPTCTTNGYTTYTCSSCGNSYVGDEVATPGHNYEAVVTEPTCTDGGYTTYTCSVCGDSYVADEVDAIGHDFVDGSCANCGEADPDAEDPDADLTDENMVFMRRSLSLQDYIGVQCIMQKSLAADYDSVYALIEYDDGSTDRAEPIVYATDYYVFEVPMLSTQMCEEVTMTLCGEKDGEVYTGESTTASVRTMGMNILNGTNESSKKIVANMLNYGAAVQTAFGINADDLANALMTSEHQTYATADTPNMEATNTTTGSGTMNPVSVAMSMQDKVELQFVFAQKDMSAYEAHITVSGETEIIDGEDFDVYSGSYSLLRIPVKAADLREVYEVAFYEKSTGESVSKTYMRSVQALAHGQLGGTYNDVAITMMKYGDAVAALS